MNDATTSPETAQEAASRPANSLQDLLTGGSVRRITRWGEPVMHEPTAPVTSFGPELHDLVRDMFATMEAAQGVGLAGTQVGESLSIFVYNCPDDDGVQHLGVVCNPVITLPDGRDRLLDTTDEGCLSFPGAFEPLARPDRATCTGQDAFGNHVTLNGTGLFARCLQHEADHCEGTVFGDRLSARARRRLDEERAEFEDEFPSDWPISERIDLHPELDEER